MGWRILDPQVLLRLARGSWTDQAKAVLLEWLSIAAAIALCRSFFSWPLYALATIWIGARQHALAVLAHEGVHRLLLGNRRLNDLLARVFLAWPVLIDFDAYRRVHFRHHRHVNSPQDPDWTRNRYDAVGGRGWQRLARLMAGTAGRQQEIFEWFVVGRSLGPWPVVRGLYYATIAGAAIWAGGARALLMYWFVPLLTWFLVTMRLKGVAEHFALGNADTLQAARTIIHGRIARLLLFPRNAAYHLEHHLYPRVPHHRLPELHAELMRRPEFSASAPLVQGYLAFARGVQSGALVPPKL
jgi:fatty acid desaturase